ncbi:uncharacterized protein HMPREF1541_02225 [Cyphellophora europaea CBS 101466]|uniref:Rhodopsin domain-containing protein n=1 Tax=Cyphellophora europaea (strain CBS 101466) TaxID=1220924 RepID=W2S2Z8_CYPE1|nr:uncharacterized protein HMPREF1541_02225 [Cyphellophora europaea CBS 101466]ETN43067.1 hypothetical protein HMPREF1541_02225 [Cyphellophora europaea CBS 101466]
MAADRGQATSSVTLIFTVIATVFIFARFFTRIWLMRSIKNDDWWILAAWLVAVGFSTSICVGVRYGLGKHRDHISDGDFASLREAQYALAILYNPALMLTKTSIITFFLSVMSRDVDKVFKWCNWLTLAVVNVGGAAFTFLAIFQCIPVAAGYKFPIPDNARCTDIVTLYLSSAPVNIITDIAILLLPMPILTSMRLPKKQKIILVFTFSFGAFVAVVDVVRLAYLQNASTDRLHEAQANSGTRNPGQLDNDFSYDASLSFMWSAVEVHLGIICASVPGLKPLFLRFLPSFIKDAADDSPPNTRNSTDAGQPDAHTGPLKSGNISTLNNPAAFRRPVIKEYAGSDDGDNMGFLNMLAGPDEDAQGGGRSSGPGLEKTRTNTLRLTRTNTQATVSDFGFVKMAGTKNMLKLSNKQSVWPIAVVTVIFFLWGFAYGLLDQLNAQFQRVVKVSTSQGLALHAAYFSGYLVGPLSLGQFILKRYGFKASMMTGLCVYGCGTLVFWPSAVLTSYTAFVISNFIVGFGLSCLEIAANPFIALCGPLEYAEVRLNLSQAFQAVGTVCSPLLARKVLFDQTAASPSLLDTQWAYLGIALFVYALAIAFYYIPLPEATDEELAELADRREAVYNTRVGPWKVIYVTLGLGVFSQWCYVALQESIGGNTQTLYRVLKPNSSLQPADYQTVGHTVFAIGRFLAAFLNYVLKPRWILLVLYGSLIILCAVQMTASGAGGAAAQLLIIFFEAGIFAIIFAMCMRGLGRHTKTGSAFMTAAISGGSALPVIQWAAANVGGIKYSYCVPLAAAAFAMLFPIYLNLVPAAKRQVDPIHERRLAQREKRAAALQRSDTAVSRAASVSNQFGIVGIVARHKKHNRSATDVPSSEHVERPRRSPTLGALSEKDGGQKTPERERDREKEDAIVQLQSPQGLVGDLQPWPDGEGGESSNSNSNTTSGGSQEEQERAVVARHRPIWDEDDFDDYHDIMRKM